MDPDYADRVFNEVVRRVLFGQREPVLDAITVFVGGQPGSGKTMALRSVAKLFHDNNVVLIVGDDFRRYHPDFSSLVRTSPIDMPDVTAQLAGRITRLAVDYAIENGYSCIIEGTWRNKDTVLETAKHSKSYGRTNRAYFVSTNPDVSLFSTMARFFMEPDPLFARWTNPRDHNRAITGIPETISAVATSGLFDALVITNRDGNELYSGADGSSFLAAWKDNAGQVLDSERLFIEQYWREIIYKMRESPFVLEEEVRLVENACIRVLEGDWGGRARKYEEAGVPILEAEVGVRPDLETPVIPVTEEPREGGDPASEVRDALLKGAREARCKDDVQQMPEGLKISDEEALTLEPEELAEKMAAQDAWKAEHQPSAAERLANAEALANDDTNEIDRPGTGSRGPHR